MYKGLLLIIFTLPCFGMSLQEIVNSFDIVDTVPRLENSVSYIDNVALRGGQTQDQSSGDIDSEVEVRLSLKGLKEQEQLEQLYNNQQKRLEADRLTSLNKELGLVYRLFLKLYFGKTEVEKLKKLKVIFQDEIKVLNVYIKKDNAYISDLISAEKKSHEVEKQLTLKQKELSRQLELLSALLEKKLSLNNIPQREKLLSLKNLVKTIREEKTEIIRENLELERAKLEYEIEVGDNSKLFDFIQFDVDRRNAFSDTNDLETRVGFTIAVNLPFLREKSKVNEKFINKLKAEYTARYEQKATVATLDQIKTSVLSNAQSLEKLLESSYLATAKKYLKTYQRSKGVDPLKLLTLNHTIVEGEVEQAQLTSQLYISYISYLEERGVLAKYPKKNVIASNFREVLL
ncbi:MAG: hypothetical protein CME65_13215 [Halobacteriovoraceae bacterium]|nr:hypothetical protein [Halobacteriovoraceae bacterium]|tara:strand:+ start:33731 stop:34936 length:1206 start_codon:yes stop_codon:yes gene_type:complete